MLEFARIEKLSGEPLERERPEQDLNPHSFRDHESSQRNFESQARRRGGSRTPATSRCCPIRKLWLIVDFEQYVKDARQERGVREYLLISVRWEWYIALTRIVKADSAWTARTGSERSRMSSCHRG